MSCQPSNAFIKENESFVLKLKIKAPDGTNQIRRIRLPRLVDPEGRVSYQELVDLCLTFTVPNEPAGKYEVTLTYFDEDADTVTIASTDELIDAIEQFSKAKVLRVATEVKAKAPVLETPVPVAPPREECSGPSMASRDPIPPQVHNVLDTFVGVLSMAVSHLQEGLAATPDRPSSLAPTNTTSAPAPGVPEEQPATELTTPQEKNPETLPFLHFRHTCDGCRVTPIQGKRFRAQNHPDYDLCEDCYSNYTGSELTFEEIELEHDQKNQQLWRNIQTVRNGNRSQNQEINPPAVAAPTPAPPVPFIHGRHTCDSCLTTPIIGKRFHAVNMPDYDLCENCHLNYTGSAIRFEAAELERDRPFQVRWQRRHQKMERFQKRKGRLAMNHQRRFAMRNARGCGRFERARMGSSGNCESEVIPNSNQASQVPEDVNSDDRAHPSEVQPSSSSSINRTNDFDDALKEAIRRSLRDITKDTESASPLVNEQPLPATFSENTADSHGPVETEEEVEPDIVVNSEEAINTNATNIIINDDSSMKDNHTLSREDAKTMEDAMDTASVDSEKLAGEADSKPAVSSPGTARYFKDTSFESDAAGSGDVAEAVGATLDLVAGMISDMLTEADMPEGTLKSSDAAAVEAGVKEEAAASSDPGALIVDEAVSGESEWEVVGQDGEGDFENPNEEMARAAEMLGSALFNSSTKDSEEHNSQGNVSNLSDSFSIPSTVPSIHVGDSQRARWLAQLEQLRELGFQDEAKCVEILERLQAANIGVESGDDDVDLAKVVDLILQDN